jgi:hypothetical protein
MLEIEKLTSLFRILGADEPESWASSQVNEGINQLGRFLFLKQAWSKVIDENDNSWIDREVESFRKDPDASYSGAGRALSAIIETGAHRQDITDLVRGMQADLLFSLCYLLDDPGDVPAQVKEVNWCLFQIAEDGTALTPIQALHESVWEMDPTGREMRTRSS